MTKGKKFKNQVRARAQRNNQPYAVARRIHTSQLRGPFGGLVAEVIRLVTAWRCEEDARRPRGSTGVTLGAAVRELLSQPMCPSEKALLALLDLQSDADLHKLQALMYAGRGDGDLRTLHEYLGRKTRQDVIRTLTEKSSILATYLRRGVVEAANRGVNIEASF